MAAYSASGALDHFLFAVPEDQFNEIVSFYLAALAPIGYSKQMEFPGVVGIGTKQRADFWMKSSKDAPKKSDFHLAFRGQDHKAVDAFYDAAIKAGGKDNGKPGVRTMYHENYYAAFVQDPLGNNLEVVDHKSQ